MKRFKVLLAACLAACALFASCSSELPVGNPQDGENNGEITTPQPPPEEPPADEEPTAPGEDAGNNQPTGPDGEDPDENPAQPEPSQGDHENDGENVSVDVSYDFSGCTLASIHSGYQIIEGYVRVNCEEIAVNSFSGEGYKNYALLDENSEIIFSLSGKTTVTLVLTNLAALEPTRLTLGGQNFEMSASSGGEAVKDPVYTATFTLPAGEHVLVVKSGGAGLLALSLKGN